MCLSMSVTPHAENKLVLLVKQLDLNKLGPQVGSTAYMSTLLLPSSSRSLLCAGLGWLALHTSIMPNACIKKTTPTAIRLTVRCGGCHDSSCLCLPASFADGVSSGDIKSLRVRPTSTHGFMLGKLAGQAAKTRDVPLRHLESTYHARTRKHEGHSRRLQMQSIAIREGS